MFPFLVVFHFDDKRLVTADHIVRMCASCFPIYRHSATNGYEGFDKLLNDVCISFCIFWGTEGTPVLFLLLGIRVSSSS